MARSRVSLGIEAFLACSTTRRKWALVAVSAPLRAAMVISFTSLPKILPLALDADSLCLTFHCAPMTHSLLSIAPRRLLAGALGAEFIGQKKSLQQKTVKTPTRKTPGSGAVN